MKRRDFCGVVLAAPAANLLPAPTIPKAGPDAAFLESYQRRMLDAMEMAVNPPVIVRANGAVEIMRSQHALARAVMEEVLSYGKETYSLGKP